VGVLFFLAGLICRFVLRMVFRHLKLNFKRTLLFTTLTLLTDIKLKRSVGKARDWVVNRGNEWRGREGKGGRGGEGTTGTLVKQTDKTDLTKSPQGYQPPPSLPPRFRDNNNDNLLIKDPKERSGPLSFHFISLPL
jgi:hypothetical protein